MSSNALFFSSWNSLKVLIYSSLKRKGRLYASIKDTLPSDFIFKDIKDFWKASALSFKEDRYSSICSSVEFKSLFRKNQFD